MAIQIKLVVVVVVVVVHVVVIVVVVGLSSVIKLDLLYNSRLKTTSLCLL